MNNNRQKTGNSGSFKPGVSGNPKGRPKRSQEEKDTLGEIKALAPVAAREMRELLENPKTSEATKFKVIKFILEQTCGKPKPAAKRSTARMTMEATAARIAAIAEHLGKEDEKK